ncbi:MAG: bifunctional fructose-bisphosphatase/inositol-phosphate phosphatase [Methanocorpusculum sp.]|nr:bifunctional fructose-bisphosphatase/inositol-phosphate phosphatase [Methanocorpusculum sp.]
MYSSLEFFRLCKKTAKEIEKELVPLIGTSYGAEELCMGADNTPTERLDKIAEDIVIKNFSEKKFCKYILSEEAGMVDIDGKEGIAYLDPIDGSFNAGAGIPFYALSIGLSDGEKMIYGFVKNLASGEIFTAELGKGAFLNGNPIKVSEKSELGVSAISFYSKAPDMIKLLHQGLIVRRGRKLGASAIELCYVACGRLEAFLDMRGTLRITDAAAGILICREAGGIVSLPNGSPCVFPDDVKVGRQLLAANPHVHKIISQIARSV